MAFEVFRAFLKLGLTSFGGPIAHLGYFRSEFVERRRWLDERRYADLVALCQFLPGPASSQVGFAIGLERAGWRGALAAWLGFTLPSAIGLVLFARGLARLDAADPVLAGVLQSLKIVAVAVVAQAVASMVRALCPDTSRRLLALFAAAIVLAFPSAAAQVVALAACAVLGGRFLDARAEAASLRSPGTSAPAPAPVPPANGAVRRWAAWTCAALFVGLALALPLAAAWTGARWVDVFDAFYRAGALVFGGGHVVLPLLQAGVVDPGWVDESQFLAGYGAAQAVPGPLFTFAAYLGSVIGAASFSAGSTDSAAGAWLGAGIGLVSVFLPGCLVLVAALPSWDAIRRVPALRRAIDATQAGVVGILFAALIDPVATGALHGVIDALVASALFALLAGLGWRPLAVVAAGVATGLVRGLLA